MEIFNLTGEKRNGLFIIPQNVEVSNIYFKETDPISKVRLTNAIFAGLSQIHKKLYISGFNGDLMFVANKIEIVKLENYYFDGDRTLVWFDNELERKIYFRNKKIERIND